MKPFSFKNPIVTRNAKNYTYDPCKHGVSQSMLATWLNCREMSRLATVLGWTEVALSKPLTFGNLAHGAMEEAYNDLRHGKISTLQGLLKKVPSYLAASEFDLWQTSMAQTTSAKDLVEECMSMLMVVLPAYHTKWWTEDHATIWLLVEDAFSVPLKMPDGKIVPMVGKFDAVIQEKKAVGVFETKTKGQWSAEMLDLLPLDLQLSYYITALHHKKMMPSFARYNIVRRPGERRKVEESMKDFTARVDANMKKDPEHYFERYDEQLTKADVDKYVRRAQALVEAFYLWWKETDHESTDLLWNSSQCETKYGTCRMLPICAKQDFGGHRIREVPSPELHVAK